MFRLHDIPDTTLHTCVPCRGSLVQQPPKTVAVVAARVRAQEQLRSAWSQEALMRGVQHAKAGQLQLAISCYDQALELNSRNSDAHVARGAAMANQGYLQQASG